jgi:hypothetical protein
MKKITLVIVCAVMAATMSSCEKNYTCTCVYPGSTIGTTSTTYKAKKKSDAEAACSAQNVGAKANGGSCAL